MKILRLAPLDHFEQGDGVDGENEPSQYRRRPNQKREEDKDNDGVHRILAATRDERLPGLSATQSDESEQHGHEDGLRREDEPEGDAQCDPVEFERKILAAQNGDEGDKQKRTEPVVPVPGSHRAAEFGIHEEGRSLNNQTGAGQMSPVVRSLSRASFIGLRSKITASMGK